MSVSVFDSQMKHLSAVEPALRLCTQDIEHVMDIERNTVESAGKSELQACK